MIRLLDPRSILKASFLYNFYQKLVGGVRARRLFITKDVNINPNQKILDIGCGPGYIIDFLPEVNYTGFDIDPNYIETAKKTYPDKSFTCSSIETFHIEDPHTFDVVICAGVLHHLNDEEASTLFKLAKQALKPEGRLLTFDGCYVKNQNPVAKKLLDLDRGKYVRTKSEYLRITKQHFSNIETKIDTNYFHIPYTSIVIKSFN